MEALSRQEEGAVFMRHFRRTAFSICFILFFYTINSNSEEIISFDQVFQKEKEISLQTKGLNIHRFYQLYMDSDNNLLFLDPSGCQILFFDQDGKFLKKIGRRGQGPGEFIVPLAVGLDSNGNIYVADSQARRVNKFDREGYFISSFIYSSNHTQPKIVRIDSKGNQFFSGLTWSHAENRLGDWINKYDSGGKYIKSFCPYNTDQDWVRSMYPQFGFDMDKEDRIYTVQINKYEISVYDTDGNLVKKLEEAPKYFKEPDPGIHIDYSKYPTREKLLKKLTNLSESWTRILRINVIKNRYLLLMLLSNGLVKNCSKKYLMDLWTKKGKSLVTAIQTDYQFLCSDEEGYLYFLLYTDEEEAIEKEAQYLIGKFSLKSGFN